MNNAQDLLLVTENYKGLSERNLLYTKEDFKRFLVSLGEDDRFIDDVGVVLNDSIGTTEWHTYYLTCNVTYDFRMCSDEKDLFSFLSGEYNDSLDDMEARDVQANVLSDWYWNTNFEDFSPEAKVIFNKVRENNELLKTSFEAASVEQNPLDSIIKMCDSRRIVPGTNRVFPQLIMELN